MTMRPERNREIADELDRIGTAEVGDVPPAHWAFREAAAVLAWFDPPSLRPVGNRFARQSALTWILADSEPVIGEEGEHWALQESIRRRTLRRLKTRPAMRRALAANTKRPDSATQRAFEAIVDGRRPDPELPEGSVLEAVEWVKGILDDLPSTSDLRRRAGLTRLLRPLRALVGTNFQGREDVLGQLRDYVGVLPVDEGASGTLAVVRQGVRFVRRLRWNLSEGPPLFIWGPGGVGKSTVVAKFVLDHVAVGEEDRIPFAFLNFDRAGLVADEPLTLLGEAVRQLAVQYPQVGSRADALMRSLTEALAADHGTSLSEAAGLDPTIFFEEFQSLVAEAEPRERPFLLVLDTFEEVQYLGHDRVEIVWGFLEGLQAQLPQLCTVVAGRAKPEAVAADAVYLGPFDDAAAAALVDGLLREAGQPPLEPEEMRSLLDAIGTVPLSLKLAVGLLTKDAGEGARALSGIETRRKVFGFRLLRAKAASIQGQLYGRLLDHIHDPEVRKLAYPGLVLRRLTPAIIREVLAEPCGVEVRDDEQARQLYDKLAREATLVEEVDGALEHRSDVRRLMLGDLRRQFPEQAEEIHRGAVRYYEQLAVTSDVRERAEEIYHRLWLDQPFETIEKRWLPGVETYLKGALEELEPPARRYLARRLGVTPDEAMSAEADLQEWEQLAAASARRLLAARDSEAALRELRRRSERSDAGPIYALEAEALRLLGRWKEATRVALRGLEAAGRAGDLAHAADLEMILTLVHEARGDLDAALAAARRTRERAGDARQPAVELRAMVAELRLLRKQDEAASVPTAGKRRGKPAKAAPVPGEVEDAVRRAAAMEIELLRGEILARSDRLSRRDLLRHATLVRELAAEVAAERPVLLRQSLRLAGFQAAGDEAEELHEVASLLAGIDSAHDGDDIAIAAGLDPEADRPQAWRHWVDQRGSRLGRSVADLLEKVEITQQGVDAVRSKLRQDVDLAIRKPFG